MSAPTSTALLEVDSVGKTDSAMARNTAQIHVGRNVGFGHGSEVGEVSVNGRDAATSKCHRKVCQKGGNVGGVCFRIRSEVGAFFCNGEPRDILENLALELRMKAALTLFWPRRLAMRKPVYDDLAASNREGRSSELKDIDHQAKSSFCG